MQQLLDEFIRECDALIARFEEDVQTLRVGRASPSMVERVTVSAYGSPMELVGLAAISTPDARTIVIQPWDMSLLPAIQKALEDAKLGMMPMAQENRIMLSLPSLTAERKVELAKMLGKKTEDVRIAMRMKRDKVKSAIADAERAKTISEDEKFRLAKELEKGVEKITARIATIEEKKRVEFTS